MSLDEVCAILKTKRGFRAGGPASPLEIDRIERLLGIRLTEDYKGFLRVYAYARWFGHAIYGSYLPEADSVTSYDYDAARLTLKARSELLPDGFVPFPREASVIDRYDAGGYYILFSGDSPRAGSVALLDHEQMGAVSQEWKSLEEFIRWIAR